MARRMSNNHFVLKASEEKKSDGSPKFANFDIVQSAVYTLTLDAEGHDKPVELGKAELINKDQPLKGDGTNNYRFQSITAIPKMENYDHEMAWQMSNDQLIAELPTLIADIELYDANVQFETPDGRMVDRKEYIVPRKVDAQGNETSEPAMSTAQYIAASIYRNLRLKVQAKMYEKNIAEAEATMRHDLDLKAPAGKPKKARKTKDQSTFNPLNLVQ